MKVYQRIQLPNQPPSPPNQPPSPPNQPPGPPNQPLLCRLDKNKLILRIKTQSFATD